MLTESEERFLVYWSEQRQRKKQFLRKFSIGLPLGVLVVVLIMVNMLSGWYQKADMTLRSNSSLIIVVLIALVAIVVFIVLFSAHHKWDQNEQYFQEIRRKKEEKGMDAAG